MTRRRQSAHAHLVVLCIDEKSQIQALDRTSPILPLLPGTPERATHDYERNGTSSLYAALDLATGKVIGSLHQRHRAVEFNKFLNTIDQAVPAHLDVHIVLDNACAWIEDWNENPRPYVWTKTADQILESIARYCQRINQTAR